MKIALLFALALAQSGTATPGKLTIVGASGNVATCNLWVDDGSHKTVNGCKLIEGKSLDDVIATLIKNYEDQIRVLSACGHRGPTILDKSGRPMYEVMNPPCPETDNR